MDSVEQEARFYLEQGRKIEAIKKVMELTGKGLKEAKDYVDALELAVLRARRPAVESNEELEFAVRDLVDRGRKIEAIKKVMELSGMGLKEAKKFVDSL